MELGLGLEYFMGGRLGLLAPSQAGYGAWGACRKAAASAERLLVRWGQEAREARGHWPGSERKGCRRRRPLRANDLAELGVGGPLPPGPLWGTQLCETRG
jgi:hypothetical protein